jgi:hypothetical protein
MYVSGTLIHRQYSYAPRSWPCVSRREAQGHEPVNGDKNVPVYMRVEVGYTHVICFLCTFVCVWSACIIIPRTNIEKCNNYFLDLKKRL